MAEAAEVPTAVPSPIATVDAASALIKDLRLIGRSGMVS